MPAARPDYAVEIILKDNRIMPQNNTPRPAADPASEARAAVNAAAVQVVARGFEAIDELAEIAKRELKKAILRQFRREK